MASALPGVAGGCGASAAAARGYGTVLGLAAIYKMWGILVARRADDPSAASHVLVVRVRAPILPHGSRGPIRLCPSCDKSSRAYNSDVCRDAKCNV